MTPLRAHQIALDSITICEQLGITGRVFADDQQAFAITEGPTDIVRQYYQAVAVDPLVENTVLHVQRKIPRREFVDYSVWLNLREHYDMGPQVRVLSPANLSGALPKGLSTKVRFMIEAILKPELLPG